MHAVILSGGKQYRVKEGDTIKVEMLDAEPGSTIEFDKVLMVSNADNVKVGTPYLEGAKVAGELVKHGRGDKIRILKFKRRKHQLKQNGHRQSFSEVKIIGIKAD